MRHLRKYNESKKNFVMEDLENIFAHSFDICTKHEIDIIYFDPKRERDYAHNDFSNGKTKCLEGYEVTLGHEFYDFASIDDFAKYVELINEIKGDIDRFISIYNPRSLFFNDSSSDDITIIIFP